MKNININKYFFGIALILFFSGSFLDLKAGTFTSVLKNPELSILFPEIQEYSGVVYSLGGSHITPFSHTIKVDQSTGNIVIYTVGTEFEYQGQLDPYLQIKTSDFIFKNSEMINFLGHDQRVTRYDPERKNLIVKYFLNNQEKKTKVFTSDCSCIDSDALPTFLQGMLLNNTGDFNLDLIQKAKGLRINADFKLIAVDNPLSLSTEYHFPPEFRNSLQQINKVYIYVMKLTGLPGLVYPYKYYFVYHNESPYQLVAYWGGESKEAEFGFLEYIR